MNFKLTFCFFLTIICFLGYSQTGLLPEDHSYKPSIKTVMLYPHASGDNTPKNQLRPSVGILDSDTPLFLEFDDLSSQYQNYHVKIMPYSSDWQPLRLNEVEYISEYNDFIISDYQLSFSTKIPYYHYRFQIPQLKLAGNYLLYIYKERNKNDIVLSHRFMVCSNRVGLLGKVQYSNNLSRRNTHQQIDFEVNYGGYQILNPKNDLKIVIRQNFRWDKTIANLKPQFDRAGEGILDYNFYNSETDFEGGNEFRFFDTRSLRSRMVGVRQISYLDDGYDVNLYVDQLQSKKNYVFTDDFDGQYLIDHYENGNGDTQADYANIKFNLESPEVENTDFYVVGAFNNYTVAEENKFKLDPTSQFYSTTIPLKQGIYNYQIVAKNMVANQLGTQLSEGNHSRTQNTYEIFVYHKIFGARSEPLVGYKIMEANIR